MGTLSVTIGIGLDGGFVDWATDHWPTPDELVDDMVALRHFTLVDQMTAGRLGSPHSIEVARPKLVVCDPAADEDGPGMIGRRSALRLLRAWHRTHFIHVAGGAALAGLALESDAVGEIDATVYPVTGGPHLAWNGTGPVFRRLSVVPHEDGRVMTTWRRTAPRRRAVRPAPRGEPPATPRPRTPGGCRPPSPGSTRQWRRAPPPRSS